MLVVAISKKLKKVHIICTSHTNAGALPKHDSTSYDLPLDVLGDVGENKAEHVPRAGSQVLPGSVRHHRRRPPAGVHDFAGETTSPMPTARCRRLEPFVRATEPASNIRTLGS